MSVKLVGLPTGQITFFGQEFGTRQVLMSRRQSVIQLG